MRTRSIGSHGRRATPHTSLRARARSLTAGCLAVTLAASALVLGAAAPAAADPPTGGSAIVAETFTGASIADPAWTVQGGTCLTGAPGAPPAGAAQVPACTAQRVGPVPPLGVTPGYLQLTDQGGNRAGSILYNKPIPASAGVSITFDQYQYGGNGADGIGFFLVDGGTSLTATGGLGGSLGYAQRNSEPGIVGGFLGVGLDSYGNFWDDGEGRGRGCPADQRSPSTVSGPVAPNVISLRGPGAGIIGYCLLGATVEQPVIRPNNPVSTLNGGSGTLRANTLAASKRTINIVVEPLTAANPNPDVVVQVRYTDAGPWITELTIPAPPNIPSTYKFGLSASTGGSNDIHLVTAATIQTVDPLPRLQLEKQVDRSGAALPAIITAGTVIPYQYTVTNVGAPVTGLTIADDKIATAAITCDRTALTTAPAIGSSAVCRGSYTVAAADVAAGVVLNTAVATAFAGGLPVTSPPANERVPLVSALGIVKSVVTPGPYSIGQQVEYSYTLTNQGGSSLTTFNVTDNRILSASPIICESGTLAPGESTSCTGRHAIAANQLDPAGFLVNEARATARTPLGQTVNAGPALASIPVAVDIGVTKTVDVPNPIVGETVTFTIGAINNGPGTATAVEITDAIPTGDPVGTVVYVGSTPSGGSTFDPVSGLWNIGTLASGESRTLTIRVTVNTGSPFTNGARLTNVDQPDRDPSNNQASVTLNPVTPTADIAVQKTVDIDSIPVGQQATFRVDVTNNGPFAATGVVVNDQIPSGLELDSSSGVGTYDEATGAWTIGALGVGQVATRTFTVIGLATGSYTNLAASQNTQTPVDPNPTNNAATAVLEVVSPVSDLAIVKTPFPQTGVIGDEITYQLAATNLGPDAAVEVGVADVWPDGVSVLSASVSKGTISADGTTWTIGALVVGESVTATVTGRLTAAGTQVNTATITSPVVIDPDPTNNSASGTVTGNQPELDIGVTKTVTVPSGDPVDAIPVGRQVSFTLTAVNTPGPANATATGLEFTDALPSGLTFVSASGTGSYDAASGTWTVGTLAPNAIATLTVVATVAEGTWVNTVSLSRLDQTDTDPTNNSATAGVTGVIRTDIGIVKTVLPEVAQPGSIVTYSVVVSNAGPNDAVGVEAFDPAIIAATITGTTVPPGTTFDTATRIWDIPALASGESVELLVNVLITRAGWTRNFVAVNSLTDDPNPENNTDFADLFVPAADIAVLKVASAASVLVGDEVTFTIGLVNNGPDAADAVTLVDVLPDGFTFVSAVPSVGGYDAASGVWTIGRLEPANQSPRAGQAETLVIVARADAPGTFTNTATSDRTGSFPYDPDPTNNTSSAVVQVDPVPAQLTLSKAVSSPEVTVGSGVIFTLVVGNSGPAPASDVVLTDAMPASFTPTAVRGPGCTLTGRDVSCALGELPVGETRTVEVDALVNTVGSFTNVATAVTTTPTVTPGPVEASAVVAARALPPQPPSGGGGSLPATGGVLPVPSLVASVALLALGTLLLLIGRRMPRRHTP